MDKDRTIICIDMDAFFASVEQKANPALRGKPIAVVGRGHRTVVTTSSYEARAMGVKTGMNVWEAKAACPQLILVTGSNARYTHTCAGLEKIYSRYTPDLEVYSIDEAFLDITHTHHLFGGPEALAQAIKRDVRAAFGIACTAGIGPNVLMAKLASDLGKPDGLMWITPNGKAEALENLQVRELWGIGKKTGEKLAAMGIHTCGELGRAPASLLRNRFGIIGEALKNMGKGICHRPVQRVQSDAKTIGHSMTLPHDVFLRNEIATYLLRLSERVGRRARKHGYMGRKVALTLRYSDFETLTKQNTLKHHTNDTHAIYHRALGILDGIRLRSRVRLLGVCLSSLIRDSGQMRLIESERKRRAALMAMDEVNDRYGRSCVTWASYLRLNEGAGVISPSWKATGVKHVDLT